MARAYAGILATLALVTSLAHGLIHARETDAILLGAWVSLLVFAGVGCVVGWIAGQTVDESVRVILESELVREESAERAQTPIPAA
ncbi:MAG: hypothetical protein ABIP48_02790 [Planctomycetota bacterium]